MDISSKLIFQSVLRRAALVEQFRSAHAFCEPAPVTEQPIDDITRVVCSCGRGLEIAIVVSLATVMLDIKHGH